jgi:chloride channel protein, CIC family
MSNASPTPSSTPSNDPVTDQDFALGQRLLILIAALVLGGLVGLAAMSFLLVIRFFNDLWMVPLPTVVALNLSFSIAIGIALLLAALAAGQILTLLENGRPQGGADLIEAAQNGRPPNIRAGMLSTLLALVNISGGSSVGMFGPLLHFGGCLSAALARMSQRLFRGLSLDVILGSGAAAAISAVFLTPIGAAVFAHEAIARRFGRFGAGPVILASFGAFWVSKLTLGDTQLFRLENSPPVNLENAGLAILVGLLCGLISAVYIWACTDAGRWAKSSGIPLRWRPLLPAALLFLLSPVFPHLLGPGLGSIDLALGGAFSLGLLLLLIALKILATSTCLGFGFYGGIFAPALMLGALTGAIVDLMVSSSHLTSFAAIGAASCIAAVIGAPLASIIIVLELTGSYEWTVLSMLSVVVCSQVSRVMVGRSIFDRQLAMRGIVVYDDRPKTA